MADLGRCRLLTKEILKNELINSITYVCVDCDGVLWRANNAIPGSSEALSLFRKLGKKVRFVTNNSSKSRHGYLAKMHQLKFEASLDEIITAPYCVVLHLKQLNFTGKIYLVASTGLRDELNEGGFTTLPVGPDVTGPDWLKFCLEEVKIEPGVKAVVCGFDEHFSFNKCLRAATYLKDKDCLFLATNTDETYPCTNMDIVVPGSGSMLAAVRTAALRNPTVLGKPEQHMVDCIKYVCPDLVPAKTLMVGDRLNTDILMGCRAGMKTLLVGSGIHHLDDVRKLVSEGKNNEVPDFFVPKLGDIVEMLA
ncbi:glycerol-3-phosphate phosphatase [Rhipicephalus sanguineus]|uniref:glycerol-3-phosphate phosphatase n=1 Tax=Rhipicephalus sanguineus TaxID=34632 RepID=UPI001895DBFC|nr:glycerol-3-phosphate phosphatase [Rhipicephalus sanguineus]